jgi:hypothetical protein
VLAGLAATLLGWLDVIASRGDGDGVVGVGFTALFLLGAVLVFPYAASLIGNFRGRGLPVLGRTAARIGGYLLAVAFGLAIAQAFRV